MNAFNFEVSLRFFTQTMAPDLICAQLGMEPMWLHKIGEQRKTPKGKEMSQFIGSQ
jgi:hypothetical protein